MIQQPSRPQIQQQQSPRPQVQQSPHAQIQQQPQLSQIQQQSPHLQVQQQQTPRPQVQQSPRAQVQQSPHAQIQQQPQLSQIQQQSPHLQVQQSPHAQIQQQPQLSQSPRLQVQQSPHAQIQQQPQLSQSPRLQVQQQQSPCPQVQQSPRVQIQQQSPRPQVQQPSHPQAQHQSPRPRLQQSPRSQFKQQPQLPQIHQQSPRPQTEQYSAGPISQGQVSIVQDPPILAPQPVNPVPQAPLSLPQEVPQQHQFINPAELFVQTPLPTAPRSRYPSLPQFDEISTVPLAADEVPPLPPPQKVTSMPAPATVSAPSPARNLSAPAITPQEYIPNIQPQQTFQAQQPQQLQQFIRPEKLKVLEQPPAKLEVKLPPATPTPKSNPVRPQPTPSPADNTVPQVVIPAPSPDIQVNLQNQSPKKQQLKKQPSHQSIEKPKKSSKPPVDYQVLLLSLADEYLNAAHSHGTTMALSTRRDDVEEYYKLISTGLGCLEAVLKNWRLQPRKEALVRLRYARTLFEETENDLEAETALSKGIDLCERNRMLDLKYSMQHLLARMLHKSNPKASLKAVDGMIQDVEAYRHAAWEYAFRFLRVSLSLSAPTHQNFVQALQHLHKIAAMANRNGDRTVAAMAAVIEALAHLQQGAGSDAIEQAQRAVAIARSHQLNDELRSIPQLSTLIQIVDICCSLLECDVNQSAEKLKVMQALVDETLNDPNWRPDGSFSVPLNGKSAGPSSIDTGDILQVQGGTLLLSFSWLPQHDLYALSYFLSSITLSAKNSYDGRKAEKFLDEGIRMIQGDFKTPQEIPEAMVNAARRVEWRRTLYCNFLLQRVFLACSRTDWDYASQALKTLRQVTQELGPNLPKSIECLMEYAAGTISQATGDLASALTIFQSPLLTLSPSASKISRNDPYRDICILSALNTVLIIRDPAHPAHSHLPAILTTLESFCQHSPNKYIQAAYFLVCSTVHTDSTIQTKQYLQQALQSATAISNSQITCMTLTFMSWKYFRGVVGEQAEKSARAGRAMAKRANHRLWASVTDEMLADTLERQGKGEEASSVREEGQRLVMGLPPGLKRPT
ncbi:hypothetical protein N7481_007325 [Penicillium waksmanii]|uniref:uncharacterized protein n=1 Tax=Penicillium waksmanii TaxID=69791 RepID=UPI002549324A|nr:uncharacterized protein N7481_007325 [Penicillium waksmanii]KAJ5980027.1 hypothetical protein N7481_007325 [Penicillium waksmanii]